MSKDIKIRITRREGNDFYAMTMGGKEIRFQTTGENDPRFKIMGMMYIEGKEMNLQIPDEVKLI